MVRLFEPLADFVHHRRPHAETIQSHEHQRRLTALRDGECSGMDSLRDAFRFLPPNTKSVQPNRIIRRDIHNGHANVVDIVRLSPTTATQ